MRLLAKVPDRWRRRLDSWQFWVVLAYLIGAVFAVYAVSNLRETQRTQTMDNTEAIAHICDLTDVIGVVFRAAEANYGALRNRTAEQTMLLAALRSGVTAIREDTTCVKVIESVE